MEKIDWTPDKTSSVSNSSGRLIVDGTRAVQVHENAGSKDQIGALVDLISLHLGNVDLGKPVAPDRITLRVPHLADEARGAIGTLIKALDDPVKVEVRELDAAGKWADATIGWDAADTAEYAGWPKLLARPRPVPPLVAELVEATGLRAVRAYPMLSTAGTWSIRVEGLEVGRATSKVVNLRVGKDGATGAQSLQRKIWLKAASDENGVTDPELAAKKIRAFAKEWRGLRSTNPEQEEHALESRILRGATSVPIEGEPLALIQPDPVVSWGSQFPTKWGPTGKTRYLDALLRDGSTPWAVEMKVQGSAGVGNYYRHAVTQAVLYREFIRKAKPLHFWFEKRGLNASDCRAVVVVPRSPHAKHTVWQGQLADLCKRFEVALVQVDAKHALRH